MHEAGWYDHQDVVACVKLAMPYLDAASCTIADEVAAAPAARVEPRPDRPLGHVDEPLRDVAASGRLRLSGWAGDYRGIREVRVCLDSQVVATSALNCDRPDVSAAYPEFCHGTDRHGWRLELELTDPGIHRLSVEAVNINGVSVEIGARVVCVPPTSDLKADSSEGDGHPTDPEISDGPIRRHIHVPLDVKLRTNPPARA